MNAFPSPGFSDTVVIPGQLAVIEGRDNRGSRHVLVLAALRPKPWTAFARARRQTNGLPYSVWLASTRDHLKAAMARSRTVAYPRDAVLGLAMSFGARKSKIGEEQRATSILSWDYTNLCKSFEDAISGTLYADDDQVRFHGPGAAIDTTADFACAHLWEGGPWKPEWTDYTIPPVEETDD